MFTNSFTIYVIIEGVDKGINAPTNAVFVSNSTILYSFTEGVNKGFNSLTNSGICLLIALLFA